MIIQIGTEADESRILWKHSKSDEWQRADIDDLIDAYESRPTGEWIPVSDIRKLEDILLLKINSFEGTRNIVEKGMLEVWKEVIDYIDGILGEDGEDV